MMLSAIAKRVISFFLFYSGALGLVRLLGWVRRSRPRIVILSYHRVLDSRSDVFKRGISLRRFERQIRYLARWENVISLREAVEHITDGREIPAESVVVTFDDGYKDNYTRAYPILKKYGIPATIFLTSGFIGNHEVPWDYGLAALLERAGRELCWADFEYEANPPKLVEFLTGDDHPGRRLTRENISRVFSVISSLPREQRQSITENLTRRLSPARTTEASAGMMLAWEEVVEMSSNGVSFGAHTLTHPVLTELPVSEARKEVLESKHQIEAHISRPVHFFAYPAGAKWHFNHTIEQIVITGGYLGACSAIEGHNTKASDVFALRRVGVSPLPVYQFATMLTKRFIAGDSEV